MNLHPTVISDWQTCKRKGALAREWRAYKWRPKTLFTSVFRKAVWHMSTRDVEAARVAMEAKATFMEVAANPGLEVRKGTQPYMIAKDWCAMLDTSIRAVRRLTLLKLHEPAEISLTSSVTWQPSSWADDSGQLHRWIVTDSWSEDDLYREMHSWYTFGDLALLGCPMMLHILEIGRENGGRRASSWARGFKHPGLSGLRMHFRKGDGSPLVGWKPIYLADQGRGGDPDDWVEQMAAEGECDRLLRHVTIDVPSDRVCRDTRAQILDVAEEITVDKRQWRDMPMSRAACDGNTPCTFQNVCHQEKFVDIAELGIYKRTGGTSTAKEVSA